MIKHLNGYFTALDDINGGQNEFTTRAILIQSDDNILNELKFFTIKDIKNLEIIKKKAYKDAYGVSDFLKLLILPKPFSGLYPPWNSHIILDEKLKLYKDYCIGHITDYINFSFMEEGIDFYDVLQDDIYLLLVEREGEYFIALRIEQNNIKMFLFFYRKLYQEKDFIELFEKIVTLTLKL